MDIRPLHGLQPKPKPQPARAKVVEPTTEPDTDTVHSPFLLGTNIQFAWDSTSLGYLKTCPYLYYLTMIEGWDSKEESIHLRFGIEYHFGIERYHVLKADGLSHKDALRDTIHELLFRIEDWEPDLDTKAGQYKNKDTLIRSVIWYLEYYREDAAKTYILSDGTPAVEQSFKFELDYGPEAYSVSGGNGNEQPYILCGHLDRVVTFNDELFVEDHKTTTTTPSDYYFKQFEPNNQMSLYTLASKVVLDAPIKGVIIDAAQVAKDFTRFVRNLTYRSTDQLEEWLADLRAWLRAAERYAIEDHWPQNDMSCDKYGGCRFRDICSKSPNVRKQFLKANFTQLKRDDRWNPLKPR